MIDAPFRLSVEVGTSPSSASYRFEREVFGLHYGVPPDAHDLEFADYNDRSVVASVTDAFDQIVGHMRLIFPGPDAVAEPVKTVVEAGIEPWTLDVQRSLAACGIDQQRTWDVATLAVDRSVGRKRTTVLAALYHSLVQLALHNDVRFLLMTVDERVRSTLSMFGLPTAALPGAQPRPFCGSPASTPVWGNCADMLAHQRRTNPEAHRLVALGVGLTEVALPDADAFRLPALRTLATRTVLAPVSTPTTETPARPLAASR